MNFKKGELIFNQGQHGDFAYLIEKGKVEIFQVNKNGQEVHLAVLGEGELFGEMALFDSNIRSASTRATTDCELVIIKREQLFERVNSSDKVVQLIIRILMKRLKQQNHASSGVLFNESYSEDENNRAVEKLKFENEINDAFLNNEFKIYHQPIFSMNNRKICGSEALIRWNSPIQGMVSPGKFIDILENSSMIVPVGYWIIEECFKHYKAIHQKNPNLDFAISINVSGRQFLHFNFIEMLQQLLNKYQVHASKFKLEITERILLEGGGVIDILNQCHGLGFEISLDDFGTGFSSLQYLAQMPIDYIKIDRSFVMNIAKDEKTMAVVSSIIFLAKKLNIKVISEGIETEEEAKIMQDLGSDYAQGYLLGRPIDFANFIETF